MAADILLQQGWLAAQSGPFQRELLARAKPVQVPAGRPVYLLGDPPGGIYGLAAGSVAVSIAPGVAGPHLAHFAAPGAWFGEGSFLTGAPRRIALEAVTGCAFLHLPLAEMRRMADADPDAARAFGAIAMQNIDTAFRVIEDLLCPLASRRIAGALWRAAGGRDGVRLPITQATLGRIANASRKEVMAALRTLEALGCLGRGYGAVLIRDAALLRALADGVQPMTPDGLPAEEGR